MQRRLPKDAPRGSWSRRSGRSSGPLRSWIAPEGLPLWTRLALVPAAVALALGATLDISSGGPSLVAYTGAYKWYAVEPLAIAVAIASLALFGARSTDRR